MLISAEYKGVCERTHEAVPGWGTCDGPWSDNVRAFLNDRKPETILDYGCGKGQLAAVVGEKMTRYDPAIKKFATRPKPHDAVLCLDVLEHIEPDCLDAVLTDIQGLMTKSGVFTVSMRPARRVLADGRNAHLILQTMAWWVAKLREYFQLYAVIHYFHDGEDHRMLVVVNK